ncbi:MAG: nucleotide exchange factor GrpE [Bryobacterales bacterium]|nr:nucleotide exchange factor GrpE [Bryobacterales bacterium]
MTEPSNEANGTSTPAEDTADTDTTSISDPAEQMAALAAERDKLAASAAELNDRLLRRSAEFENFRKRTEKERLEFFEYASMEAVRAMLPILDDFERALSTGTADKDYARGMELIHQRMTGALGKLGLEPIEAVGKVFDPNIHHAVEMVSTSDAPDHTVLADLQRGYNFKGRLLRPSMVRVAVDGSGE